MAPTEEEKAWPPGTVRIELLKPNSKHVDIILQPRPSDDPNDPLNWKRYEKHWNFSLTAFYTFMVFALICSATPTWGPMNVELGFSYELLNNSYAAGCGTLAIGAILMIPFALKYGRRPLYIISTAGQIAVTIWSAKIQTVADVLLVNIVSCFLGSLSEVIVQMTIADMYFVHQRGLMNAWYILMQNSGALLGPIAAGYITVDPHLGWRWFWWILAMFWGVLFLACIFTYEETKYDHAKQPMSHRSYVPQITVHHDSVRMDILPKDPTITSISSDTEEEHDTTATLTTIRVNPGIPRKIYLQRLSFATTTAGPISNFLRHSYYPIESLFTIPAIFYMALVYGLVTMYQSIEIVTLSTWMLGPPWNFDASSIGLMSLAPFIGCAIGSALTGPASDTLILWLSKRNGGIYEPEMRLWVIVPFIPLTAVGILVFGFALDRGWGWPVVAVSYALSQVGTSPISSIALTYLTDSYTEIVGESLVGVTFIRNVVSTIFVFALAPWIDAVGVAKVYIITCVITIFILSFIGVFIWKGKHIRVWTAPRYRRYAKRQFGARRV